MISDYGVYEWVAARSRQQQESIARPARVRFFAVARGVGESRLEGKSALMFGAYMMEEPSFSSGVIMLSGIAAGGIPVATAVVLEWRKQGDFYVGANMGFYLESSDPKISVKFSLTFEGTTLRTTAPISGGRVSRGATHSGDDD